jgi:RND family efflux transporter MFP subunit
MTMSMTMRCTAALAILAVAGLAACGKGESKAGASQDKGREASAKAAAASMIVPVAVVTAGEGATGGEFVVTGTLDAIQQAPLTVKYGGIVKKLHVDVGDRVVKGQALATMDSDDRRQSLKQAEAGRAAAQEQFQTAEKDWKRFSALQEGGSISKSDQEKVELGYKAARAQVEGAKAGVALVKNMVKDAVLRAPFDGQITMRVAQLGGYMDPMMHPVMFVLVDASRLKVSLNLPEMRAALLKPGDEVTVRVPAAERTFTTKVEVLTDVVDPMTRARTAIAWIDNPGPDPVPSGSYFEARLTPEALKGRILLPSAAIRDDGKGGTVAYVVEGGLAKRREVKGRYLADRADFVVESGVNKGDLVVAEASMVRDGQAVEPVKEAVRPVQGQAKEPDAGKAEAAR